MTYHAELNTERLERSMVFEDNVDTVDIGMTVSRNNNCIMLMTFGRISGYLPTAWFVLLTDNHVCKEA